MPVEIIVHFEGSKSSIAFDALPTFNTLRRAITSDITNGNSSFLVIGSTQRGTPIVISDQTTFIRALGPRSSMIVSVRLQPQEGEEIHIQSQPLSTATSNPNNTSSAISQQQQQQSTHRPDYQDIANAVAASLSPGRNPPLATCQQIVELNTGDSRCCTFVPSQQTAASKQLRGDKTSSNQHNNPTIWVGERSTGNIRIHDYHSGDVLRVIRPKNTAQTGPHSGCLAIQFVPEFRSVASGNDSQDRIWAGFNSKDIRVFDAFSCQLIATLTEHSAAVVAIESADTSSSSSTFPFCFSSSLDFTILQWNVNSLTVARIFSRHRNGVRSLALAPFFLSSSSSLLFSGSDDRCLVAWNAQTGDVVAEGVNIHGSGIHAVSIDVFSRIWTGCEDGSVKVWQLQKLMEPLKPSASYSPHNKSQPSMAATMTMRFECVASFREHAAGVAFIKCFKSRALSSAHDGTIAVYDTDNLEALGTIAHPHDAPAVSIALSSFTTVFRFWTGSSDRKLCRWNLEDPGAISEAMLLKKNSSGGASNQQDSSSPQSMLARQALQQQQQIPSSEQNDAISLLRFTLDRTTEKTLIVAEEAKNRAELELAFERRLRSKYFVPQRTALAKFSEAALEIHRSYANTLLDTHISSGLATRSALESSSSALAYAAAEMETVYNQRDREVQKSSTVAKTSSDNISSLSKRIQELEKSLAFAREEVARTTQETRENLNREQKLQHAYDSAMERQQQLEVELRNARESKSTELYTRDKGQLLKDEQWRQQEFVLQEQIATQKNQIEEKDSELRFLRLQLNSQKQLAASRQKEIESLTLLTNNSKENDEKAIAAEREEWVRRNRDLDSKLEKATFEANETKAKLSTENAQLQTALAKLQDDLNTLKATSTTESRAKDAKIAELEKLVQSYAQSADSARNNWQKDTETLSRDLARTQNTLTRADDYAINVEREAAVDRAVLKTLEQQNSALTTENAKIRESLIVERSSAQTQIETLENTLAQLRREYNEAQTNFAAEQTARSALERRLASIERSYEELRKSVDDGASAVTQAYELDTNALARKYSELEEAANQAQLQLQEDIINLKAKIEHLERRKNEAEADSRAKSQEITQLANENREVKLQISRMEANHKSEVESLRMDIADLTHTCANERTRSDQEAERFQVEIEDLKLRINEGNLIRRKLEADLSRVTSECSAAKARAEVVSDAERKLEQERGILIEENTALRAELAAGETKSHLQQKRLLELENSLAAANQEKSRTIGSAQSQIQTRDEEIDSLRKQLVAAEQNLQALESRLADSQNNFALMEQRHHAQLEEFRRNQSELIHARDEAVALAKAAEERRQDEKEIHARNFTATQIAQEDRETELRQALDRAERQNAGLRAQLENAESALVEWRETATRARAETQDHDRRTSEQAIFDQDKIAKLEAAVAKGVEVEQLLEEQANGYKLEAQRAREQMLLLTREVSHTREELKSAKQGSQEAELLRAENRRLVAQVQALQDESAMSTQIAVKRLSQENDDLRRRFQQLQSSSGSGLSAGGFARVQQLENENEVLHGRIATLDAERNAAWKELQQLLEDHKLLHRQFTELKSNNNKISSSSALVQSPSSEVAMLRQQFQIQNTPAASRSASISQQNSGQVSTRGAALAMNYTELLGGVKDMLRLLQRNSASTGMIDPITLDQMKRWMTAASVKGEAVAQSLFTEDEKRRLFSQF